jgi:hypothetical protein
LPDGLADAGAQGEQSWPQTCCEESAGHRNPVVAVLVREPLDVSKASGGEVGFVEGLFSYSYGERTCSAV